LISRIQGWIGVRKIFKCNLSHRLRDSFCFYFSFFFISNSVVFSSQPDPSYDLSFLSNTPWLTMTSWEYQMCPGKIPLNLKILFRGILFLWISYPNREQSIERLMNGFSFISYPLTKIVFLRFSICQQSEPSGLSSDHLYTWEW
jgi:hypothetical protein